MAREGADAVVRDQREHLVVVARVVQGYLARSTGEVVRMARVAFLGTGHMGAPMAGRLIDSGHDVTVWNRSKEKAEPLAERGATVAATPREAVEDAEFCITMLADPDAVRDVVLGPDGAAEDLGRGSL